MKAVIFLTLVLPLILTQEYVLPSVGVDQREATCQNVKKRLDRSNSDLKRLTNYVEVTLPNRLMKLNNILLSARKTCRIISRSSPSLVQLSSYETKKQTGFLSIQEIHQQLKSFANEMFTSENHVSLLAPNQLKENLLLETSELDPQQLCQDVYDSVNALSDYLRYLVSAINSAYISSYLPERIQQLTELYASCYPDTTPTPTPTPTPIPILPSDPLKDGSVITLRCLGDYVNEAHQYLDSYTYTGGTGLAPATSGPYTGTHWRVHVNDDNSVSFESLGDFKNPNFVYLDGHTGDGTVGLAPVNYGTYSGTHWQPYQFYDGSYFFRCLGSDYNPDHLYLDGRTGDGSIGLAPHTEEPYTGTFWEVKFLP